MKTLTNNEIYMNAQSLLEAFNEEGAYLPIKVNFYIQKNKKTLLDLAQDIEKSRMDIIQRYGTENEETHQYDIAPENIEAAQNELNDLFGLTQDVNISTISLDSLDENLSLSTKQMEAIMFMIEE